MTSEITRSHITTIGIEIPTTYDGQLIQHISELPLFQEYTVEELRYYDYVHEGFIIKRAKSIPYSNYQETANQDQSQVFSPWAVNFPHIQNPQPNQFYNPYGELSSNHFQEIPEDDQNQIPDFIPDEPNFNNSDHSIFSPFGFNQFS